MGAAGYVTKVPFSGKVLELCCGELTAVVRHYCHRYAVVGEAVLQFANNSLCRDTWQIRDFEVAAVVVYKEEVVSSFELTEVHRHFFKGM